MARLDWRNLPAVEPIQRPRRLSQTVLKHANLCERSAYLYLRNGSVPAVELDRGTAFHLWAEKIPWLLLEHDEPILDTDVAKDLMEQVLDEHPELGVTVEDAKHLREMAYHMAGDDKGRAGERRADGKVYPVGFDWRPQEVVAVERMFGLEIEGWLVVGKVDLARIGKDRVLDIVDYKTAMHVSTAEEYEGSFQGKLYGLLILFGRPIVEAACPSCMGHLPILRCENCGNTDYYGGHGPGLDICTAECVGRTKPTQHVAVPCDGCDDRGVVTTFEPCIGEGIQWARTSEVYPRYTRKDGTVVDRDAVYSRADLHEFLGDVQRLVRQMSERFDTWDWPAIRSDAGCGICPSQRDCPLPEALRSHAGTINTLEQASEALEWADTTADKIAATRKEVRAFAKRRQLTVPVGADAEYVFELVEKRQTDWEALELGVERARSFGEPFQLSEHVRSQSHTGFVKRKRTPAELLIEPTAAWTGPGGTDVG